MTELNHLARPYAQAVFELARESGDLTSWSEQLDWLAAIATDPAMEERLQHPDFDVERKIELILGVAGKRLNPDGENLVKLLVRNRRINTLPAIAALYAQQRAEEERVVEATMMTALPIDPTQQTSFANALHDRLGRRVKLDFLVDESLIGGAVIRAGDWVIDGSVKAQLEQLLGAVST